MLFVFKIDRSMQQRHEQATGTKSGISHQLGTRRMVCHHQAFIVSALACLCYPVQGNEGIDVKEGSVDTLISGNEVYMQYDPNSGGGCANYCEFRACLQLRLASLKVVC